MISSLKLYSLFFELKYKEYVTLCVCVCVCVCWKRTTKELPEILSDRVDHEQIKQKAWHSKGRCQCNSHLFPWGSESEHLTRRMSPNSAKSSCFNSSLHSEVESPFSLAYFWNTLITVSMLFRSSVILAKMKEPKRRNIILSIFIMKTRRQHFQRKSGPSWSVKKV